MKEKTSDVIVVGAGAWGLATALACLRRGLSVQVIEAEYPGARASGGLVGALSPHVPDQWNPKKQFQFEALDAGQDYWARMAEISGQPTGYARLGRIIPIKDENQKALSLTRAENAKSLWKDRYLWTVEDTVPDHLNISIAPFGIVHETLSARLDPRMAVSAMAKAVNALGGEIKTGSPVTDIQDGTVTTQSETHSAWKVFVASGVNGIDWLGNRLNKSAGGAVKGQAALFKADLGPVPQIFDDGIYIIPHDLGHVAVGSTSENTWDHEGTDELLDDVIARAIHICPQLATAEIVDRWAGFRPKAKRRDPMLGPIPGFERVYAVLGAFKIGLGLIPKVGEIRANVAEGKTVDLPDSFSVTHHLS